MNEVNNRSVFTRRALLGAGSATLTGRSFAAGPGGRIDHQTQVLKRGAENIRKPPSEYLKQGYFDTVSPIALAIRYGIDFAGIDKMLYASDPPWVDPGMIAGLVGSLRLGPEDERKVFRENPRRLFPL